MSLEQDLAKHIQKAMNTTISKIAKEQAKAIKEEFDIPLKKIKSMSRIKKASIYNLNAKIMSLDTEISIKHFKKSPIKQGKKVIGVNVKLNKNAKIALLGHFIAKNRDKGGEFIAIREDSKHMRNPSFHYQASRKSYGGFNKSSKLYYPLSSKTFAQVAKSQSQSLLPKVKEMFNRELEK